MKIEDVLSTREIEEVNRFIANGVMREAIRKVLLFGVYYNGTLKPDTDSNPLINFALARAMNRDISDEQLGRDMKISAESVIMIEDAFKQIDKFKIIKESKPEDTNPAR